MIGTAAECVTVWRHRSTQLAGRMSSASFGIFYLLSIGVGATARSQSAWRPGAPPSSAPCDFNWKEPKRQRDYADVAGADLEELAFMRLVLRRSRSQPLNRKERLAVCLSVCQSADWRAKRVCGTPQPRLVPFPFYGGMAERVRSGMLHLNYRGLQSHRVWRWFIHAGV